MTPVSASTPTQPATPNSTPAPPREASAPRAPARPSRMAQDGFDSAMRRAGERSASTDDNASVRDDDDDETPENLLATAQTAGPRATAVANTPAGLLGAPASATEAAVAMQIAQPAWSSSLLPPGALGAVPNAWSVQLTDAGLPIQQLNMQRLTAGPQAGLHLSMSTSADSRRLPLDRLRERLAAKGQEPQSLSLHAPTQDAAQDAQDPV